MSVSKLECLRDHNGEEVNVLTLGLISDTLWQDEVMKGKENLPFMFRLNPDIYKEIERRGESISIRFRNNKGRPEVYIDKYKPQQLRRDLRIFGGLCLTIGILIGSSINWDNTKKQ